MNVTERSIFEQFPFWEALPQFSERAETGKRYAVIGCGTSFNLAQSIAAQVNLNGSEAFAAPGHEWTKRPGVFTSSPVEVIIISRSGESSEAITAAQSSQDMGYHVTTLGCEAESTLVKMSDTALVAPTHQEEGIVMTASASLMLLLGMQFAGTKLDINQIITQAQNALDAVSQLRLDPFAERGHLVFLGGGDLHGIAAEGALKVQEMSCTVTQVYHPLEYRHGPISLVDESVGCTMLYSEDDIEAEQKLAGEVQALGASLIGFGGAGELSVPISGESRVRGAVMLPALQLLGERVAQFRGRDTTQPRHLNKVVRIS